MTTPKASKVKAQKRARRAREKDVPPKAAPPYPKGVEESLALTRLNAIENGAAPTREEIGKMVGEIKRRRLWGSPPMTSFMSGVGQGLVHEIFSRVSMASGLVSPPGPLGGSAMPTPDPVKEALDRLRRGETIGDESFSMRLGFSKFKVGDRVRFRDPVKRSTRTWEITTAKEHDTSGWMYGGTWVAQEVRLSMPAPAASEDEIEMAPS